MWFPYLDVLNLDWQQILSLNSWLSATYTSETPPWGSKPSLISCSLIWWIESCSLEFLQVLESLTGCFWGTGRSSVERDKAWPVFLICGAAQAKSSTHACRARNICSGWFMDPAALLTVSDQRGSFMLVCTDRWPEYACTEKVQWYVGGWNSFLYNFLCCFERFIRRKRGWGFK